MCIEKGVGRSINHVVSEFDTVKKMKSLSHLGMITVPSALVGEGCAPVFISKTESASKQERRILLQENQMVHTDGGTELYVVALMELSRLTASSRATTSDFSRYRGNTKLMLSRLSSLSCGKKQKEGTGIRWPRLGRWSSMRNTCG